MIFRKLLISSFLILISSCIGYAQTIKVMTYNIRYDNPDDGNNSWENRKGLIVNQINEAKPDIIGTQEGLNNQIKYLSSALLSYRYIGVGREDGKEKGEYAAIFYRIDKFKLISDSTFWLSSTPQIPSVGWDAALERICTYALLEEIKSGKRILVLNTHLDHKGITARRESANLILQKIDRLNAKTNFPAILTGDMNASDTDEPIVILNTKLFDAFSFLKRRKTKPEATFNGFNLNEPAKERIDYIFVNRKNAKVKSHSVVNMSIDNRYPSDHFPVISIIVF